MIAEKDKSLIKDISHKYHINKVVLFGSSIDPLRESNDIDIAIEGIKDSDFFEYYGELMFALSKPVDIIDLSSKTKFNQLILSEGQVLYG